MNLSRRLILLATAMAPALTTTLPAIADTSAIDTLWRERTRLMRISADLSEQYHAAFERLPLWARPGPAWMNADGERVGDESHLPEVKDPTPPEYKGAIKRIRVGFHEVRKDWEQWLLMFGGSGSYGGNLPSPVRTKARAYYRERMRATVARYRELEALRDALGITANLEATERNTDEIFAVEAQIKALAQGGDVNAVAAEAITAMGYEADFEEAPPSAICLLLSAVMPRLSGDVKASAQELVDNPDRELRLFAFIPH